MIFQDMYYVASGATQKEVLEAFSATLHFPEYFGGNLDAFAECLVDFATSRSVPTTVIWQVSGSFQQSPSYPVIVEILNQAVLASPQESSGALLKFILQDQRTAPLG